MMYENPDWTVKDRNPYAPSDFTETRILPVQPSPSPADGTFKNNPWKVFPFVASFVSYLGIVFIVGNGLISLLWKGDFNPFLSIFNIGGWVVFGLSLAFSAIWSKKSYDRGFPLSLKASVLPTSGIALILSALSLFTGAGALAIIPFVVFPVWMMLLVPTVIGWKVGKTLSERSSK